MMLVTAFNRQIAPLGEMCAESMRKYCARFPHHKCEVFEIPDSYDRPPSWYKTQLLSNLLTYGERVMWIDADALIVGRAEIDGIVRDNTLNIAKDAHGINCGVMAWQPSAPAIHALTRMDQAFPRFKKHKWFEQAALMEFVDELDVCYQPKNVWNAYAKEVDGGGDVDEKTLVVHWPGCDFETRLKAMQEEFSKL